MLAFDWNFEISPVTYIVVYKDLCDPRPDIVCHCIDKAVRYTDAIFVGEVSSFQRQLYMCGNRMLLLLISLGRDALPRNDDLEGWNLLLKI